MDIGNLENYTRIIAYNDDNHGIRIYVNGVYIDDMDDGIDAAARLIIAGQDTVRANPIVTSYIYLPELEVKEEIADKIHSLLCQAMKLTIEQESALINQTYEKL